MAAAEAELRAKAGEPLFQEVVLENLRSLDEALDDAVVPALARLMRMYVTESRRADAFFRGVRRLLSDLTGDEYADLCSLIRWAVELASYGNQDVVELEYVMRDGATAPTLLGRQSGPTPPGFVVGKPPPSETMGEMPSAQRLFHLLRVNGLGFEGSSVGPFPGAGPPSRIVFHRDVVVRMQKVLV
ncbi:hypothetical protein BON30_45935 [Cystobacter ferrugineus]|uniref:Uncharacterized protein n=1 Tax=Cystobacter ferrugineus TaxID=83449 RepID=A0A1L9AVH3_9BACT|nr:hypothetical protein BON30_45935 [Cystobacter ferrugineus]